MIIRVKEPTIVGILTFVSMINVVLGWVERGRFYNLRLCFGQQKYSLPKIKTIIGHPKTSPKQIPMFLPDLQKKSASLHVLWVLKRTVSVKLFFERPKHMFGSITISR